MRRGLSCLVLLGACLPSSCAEAPPAPGHVELFIETDAPLGDDSESRDPLFDSVRIELYRENQTSPCADCVRDFPLSRSVHEPSITFTTTQADVPVVAHVCLFRARWGCAPELAIETWARLPVAPAEGGAETTVSLLLASVGVPSGSREAPVPSRPGRPAPIPRWPGAEPVPCGGAAEADEVCIAGGAFWMGNPRVVDADPANKLERLVVVSPFFLDAREVSVESYRRALGPAPAGIGKWSGRERGDKLQDYCTFTAAPGPNDDLPVNCLTWNAARDYCLRAGRDLPTEAQFELAAAGQAGRLFVWGDDLPTCEDSVWGRQDPEQAAVAGPAANRCARPGSRGLPLPTKRASVGRDVLRTPNGEVRDLAGNVAEWMWDGFQAANDPCWNKRGVLRDPRCETPTDSDLGPARAVRGGAWFLGITELAAAHRKGREQGGFTIDTGFRCSRTVR